MTAITISAPPSMRHRAAAARAAQSGRLEVGAPSRGLRGCRRPRRCRPGLCGSPAAAAGDHRAAGVRGDRGVTVPRRCRPGRHRLDARCRTRYVTVAPGRDALGDRRRGGAVAPTARHGRADPRAERAASASVQAGQQIAVPRAPDTDSLPAAAPHSSGRMPGVSAACDTPVMQVVTAGVAPGAGAVRRGTERGDTPTNRVAVLARAVVLGLASTPTSSSYTDVTSSTGCGPSPTGLPR